MSSADRAGTATREMSLTWAPSLNFRRMRASRRLGSTMDGAPREGMGTILILPVVRIEREADETERRQRTGRRYGPRPPPPPPLTPGHPTCRRRVFRSGPDHRQARVAGRRAALAGVALGGCSGGDFGRTRAGFSQRRHASLDRRRGDRKRRPEGVAIPAHRQRAAAARPSDIRCFSMASIVPRTRGSVQGKKPTCGINSSEASSSFRAVSLSETAQLRVVGLFAHVAIDLVAKLAPTF